MVLGSARDLSDHDGAESTGKIDIGKPSTRIFGIRGVDTSLVAVYRRQALGHLTRALDTPAGIEIRHVSFSGGRIAASVLTWCRRDVGSERTVL